MQKIFHFLFLEIVFGGLYGAPIWATTISASGEEVTYKYTTEFRSLVPVDSSKSATVTEQVTEKMTEQMTEQAEFHAGHLFGLLMSPEMAANSGYSLELVAGAAGPKAAKISNVVLFRVAGDAYNWVRYTASGRMLVLDKVLMSWIGKSRVGDVKLPLLRDLPSIYSDDGQEFRDRKWIRCSDSHYRSAGDFSYFYDPFRCPELGQEPLARQVTVTVSRVNPVGATDEALVPLHEFHGDNGNGRFTTFYFVNGFDDEPAVADGAAAIHRDFGWKTFVATAKLLEARGFEKVSGLADLRSRLKADLEKLHLQTPVSMENPSQKRFLSTYLKVQGDEVLVARLALFRTKNESGSVATHTFPEFWKEAWESADFLYFGGHSGDGQALDLKTMMATLSASDIASIHFRPTKTQIVFFDACTSYDHYQSDYIKKKPFGLHLLTYGLVSQFHQAEATVAAMLDLLVPPLRGEAAGSRNEFASQAANLPARDITWFEALQALERDQLVAHVDHFYYLKDRPKVLRDFEEENAYPSFLINVWVPN